MSDSESFIDEVSEELRRDRLFGLMRRYGWIPVVAIIVIVGGAGWFEYQRAQEQAAAEARGDAVLTALAAEQGEAQMNALDAIPAEGDFSAVVALLKAADAEAVDDRKAAADILLGVADDQSLPRAWRDLAALKAVMLGSEAVAPEQRDTLLARLAEPGAPFALLAQEQQIYAMIEEDRRDEALAAARALSEQAGISQGLQERLVQVIVALGGEPPRNAG